MLAALNRFREFIQHESADWKDETTPISETKRSKIWSGLSETKNVLQNKLLPTVEFRNVYSVDTKQEQMLQFPAGGERRFSSV
jgi:hypothetical protein